VSARLFLALVFASLASAQTVYIYAQRDTPASKWLPITVDGAPAAELRRGTCFAIHLPPGRHSISTPSGVPLSIELAPTEPIHLRLDWNHNLNRPPIPVLSRVPRARAEQEMMFLSYIPANKIHSTAVPKSDPRPPAKPEFQTRPPQ
jgi:hypothetical protein